jgi:hypothetical protein
MEITMNRIIYFLLASVLIITLSALTMAATRTSTAIGGVWATGSTWVGGTTPANGDIVIIATTGTGSVTTGANATCAGLTINSGSVLTLSRNLTVNGTTSISGTINFGSNNGTSRTMTFAGAITINSDGVWNETSTGGIPRFTFRGGITNNGTFVAQSGIHTFNTNAQTLMGSFSIPNVTVTGVVLTNNDTLTVGTALIGSGNLTNNATGVLNIGGTSTITTLTATAAGNTVNYSGAAQTVKATTYSNLTISGTGVKTSTGVTVEGILTMASTATVSAAPTYGPTASLQYTGNTLQTTGIEFLSTLNKPVLIHNSVGVILDAPKTITDTVTIQDCYLDNSINALTVGVGGSVVLVGTGNLVAPLPVEMTSFTAVMRGTSALLNWSTATEVNNNGFEIERRAVNGEQVTVNSWIKVGFVPGAGTSNSPKSYSFQDAQLAPGAYVYRIKQIDNDGSFKYSASTQVDAGVSNALKLGGNYPNPFNPTTNIQFSVPENGYASLKVYNMLGQEVATLFSGMATAGHYIPATFNASRLASGIYFARLQFNGKSLVQRMLLTK